MEPTTGPAASPDGELDPVEHYKGAEVVVETESARKHMGYPVCDGPAVMRLMLTRPYNSQGRIVEIPVSDIESVKELEPRSLGETPPTVS